MSWSCALKSSGSAITLNRKPQRFVYSQVPALQTSSVQSATEAANTVCEAENNRLDSELSMVRYITWAIPSIGFIGTVRGIGAALGLAHQAVDGDISGVTQSLGTAFNSTFIALLISIFLMFLVHQLQLLQERLIFEAESYVDQNLIRHMQAD